ncbi:hypothetical protein PGT21_033505 [Puccinia graminis f. sp. tritici]|uniref:Uncharacterized protein n=1 Tax=Puccinia graminis f. sp. tritici TaxID=56615 RepID=A0A5B0MXQ8_PUCGR|nr:hypothetical protein PGT21_033505 [Puccinia graminis f. sp. tritici]
MVDVCPGLAQEIAKLRSTRNSGIEFKTMAERRKLAENQLEKFGGGISLGMGF